MEPVTLPLLRPASVADALDQYRDARIQLLAELKQLDEQIPVMVARRSAILTALDLASEANTRVHEQVGTWLEIPLTDPVALKLYELVRAKPGISRSLINSNLRIGRFKPESKEIDNAIAKLSRRQLIVNTGGTRSSSWYITEDGGREN